MVKQAETTVPGKETEEETEAKAEVEAKAKAEVEVEVLHQGGTDTSLTDGFSLAQSSPRVTGLEVKTSNDPNGQPLQREFNPKSGKVVIVVNEEKFISQVFRGLEVKAGHYKGQRLDENIIAEAIEIGKKLLAEEPDLFEEGVAEKYDDYQKNITARLISPVEDKRKELKGPVNEIGKIFQGMPQLVLGELLELHDKVKNKNKAYKVEKEKRDREAAQMDAAWQTETTTKLISVSGLAGSLLGANSMRIESALKGLQEDTFEPHENFSDQYTDAVAAAISTLETMLENAAQAERDAEKKAAQEKAAQEKRDAELEELRAEKAERDLREQEAKADQAEKDKADEAQLKIASLYSDAVGGSVKDLDDAVTSIAELTASMKSNKYFDAGRANEILVKANTVYLAEQERGDQEAKAEEKRLREEQAKRATENHQALVDAGYLVNEDFNGYFKEGTRIFSVETIANASLDFVKDEIIRCDNLIIEQQEFLDELAKVAAKAEEDVKAAAEAQRAAEEKAAKAKEENYNAAVAAMTEAIMKLDDHEGIIEAICSGKIPHVIFDASPVEPA